MSSSGDLGSDASSGFSDDESSSLGLGDSSDEKDDWDSVPNLVGDMKALTDTQDRTTRTVVR